MSKVGDNYQAEIAIAREFFSKAKKTCLLQLCFFKNTARAQKIVQGCKIY